MVQWLLLNRQRKKALQKMHNIVGSPLLQVGTPLKKALIWQFTDILTLDSMIDFGFVVSSFVPLVLFWMCAGLYEIPV